MQCKKSLFFKELLLLVFFSACLNGDILRPHFACCKKLAVAGSAVCNNFGSSICIYKINV